MPKILKNQRQKPDFHHLCETRPLVPGQVTCEGWNIQKVENQRKISQGEILSHKMAYEWRSRTITVSAQQHHLVYVCLLYSVYYL